MNATHPIDDEQSKLWNGLAGRAWVDGQESLDRMFQPFEDLLVATVPVESAGRVLDVGCGTGSTTLAVARRLSADGCSVGIDISDPMITAARARAAREGMQAAFLCGDVQTHPFDTAAFDMMISRFGVMFFDDPIRAFTNLRRAAIIGAGLCVIAWRSATENPFMTTAERAAAPLLPNLPARRPDAPGQFSFADPRRVGRILEQGGWADIDIRPIDVVCALPEKELVGYLSRMGPVGRVLHEADARTRARVIETVRPAFDPFVHGDEVRFTAACWKVGARAACR